MGLSCSRVPHFVAAVAFVALAVVLLAEPAHGVSYDIVYVRQPRYGDNTNTTWPEVAHPAAARARCRPHAAASRRHARKCWLPGGVGAVTDPFVSFDAQWVYYSFFYDVRPQGDNNQRGLPYRRRRHLPHQSRDPPDPAADLRRVHAQHRRRTLRRIQSGQSRRPGFDYLGYGILNLGPGAAGRRQDCLHQQPQRLRAAARSDQSDACSCSSWTRTAPT